jgi:SAM-dependent methyltransferase
MRSYIYRPSPVAKTYEEAVAELRRRGLQVEPAAVDNTSPHVVEAILQQAADLGIQFSRFTIDVPDFQRYVTEAGYLRRYPDYYASNLVEKSLEHYIALRLLEIDRDDLFVDLASEHSPVPEIYRRLTGAETYSQDIMYPEGIHGSRIGGDACNMPVPDGFATRAALTCSLEHFEGDGDLQLFQEMSRVLRPGGKLAVIPFYLFTRAATQTDPAVSLAAGVEFDADATIFCAADWGYRHGRFYSPKSFLRRVVAPVIDQFRFDYYHLVNASEVDPSVYARFALVATKVA